MLVATFWENTRRSDIFQAADENGQGLCRTYLAMSEFMLGQADRGLIDLVTNVTLVLSDIRTVLRVGLHVIFQLGSRLAVLVAIRAVQAHLKTTPRSIYVIIIDLLIFDCYYFSRVRSTHFCRKVGGLHLVHRSLVRHQVQLVSEIVFLANVARVRPVLYRMLTVHRPGHERGRRAHGARGFPVVPVEMTQNLQNRQRRCISTVMLRYVARSGNSPWCCDASVCACPTGTRCGTPRNRTGIGTVWND